MTTLTSKYSLVEQAKRINPDGTQAQIAEVLNRNTGMIFQEAPWMPANDVWTNKTTRRGSLPSGSKRKLNQRVTDSVSRTTEILDVIQNTEAYSDIDTMIVDSMPSPAMFRAGETDAFIEGIGQGVVSDIIYNDANADPDGMHGLAPRMGTVDGRFVIDGGGTGSDVASIYVVTWSPVHAFLAYPRNLMSTLGVTHKDLGEVTSETASGKMQVYRDHYIITCGLVVRDQRAIGRVANIEISGASNTFDEDDLITLLNNMRTGPETRIYMNEIISTQGQIRLKDKNNVNWTPDAGNGLSGEAMMRFQGIPVRKIDREILLPTEEAIS